MQINSAIANNSAGTQINRFLDSLGLPDTLGDSIGSIVDTQTGNRAGALRNLVDLNSGLTTRQMDSIFGGASRPSFARAFAARRNHRGAHLHQFRNTYTHREQVGKRAHIGQRYGMNWGPFHLTGRITGGQYQGSFAKPIRLGDGDLLFRGRKYDNLAAIWKDARDGRVDGFASSRRTRPGMARPFPFPNMLGGASLFGSAANGIQDILGRLFDAIGANKPGSAPNAGGTGNSGNAGDTGNTGSVMNNPNMSLEDKLALLMSKLSEHLDKQINDKMKSIESQMAKDKGGASKTSGKNGGGIFGSIGKLFGKVGTALGGVAGTAVGGPLGGMLGSGVGGRIGSTIAGLFGGGGAASSSASNSASQSGGSGKGQDSNLQLLQTQLQQLLQKRQQMFQTMSNVIKSLHDTSMNTIRQLKA